MKKTRAIALALSFFMILTTSSCLAWEDKTEGNNTPEKEERKEEKDSSTEKSGNAIPQMELAGNASVISENTPYYSAMPVDVYEAKEGESFYSPGIAATDQNIYILLLITNDKEMNAFYEQIADEEWSDELEEMYREADRKYRRTEMFILDTNGQLKTNFDVRSIIPEEMEYVDTVRTTSSGELYLTGSGRYDESTGIAPRIILKLDADGNPAGEPQTIIPEKTNSNQIKDYYSLAWDNQNNLFVSGYTYPENGGESKGFIDVLDPQGKLLFTLEDESGKSENGWQFNDTIFVDQDTVYASIYYFDGAGEALAEIDMEEQKLGKEVKIDLYTWQATVKDGKIYAADSSGLQGFSFENQLTEPVFYWKDLDLNVSGDSSRLFVISEDTIFLSYENYDMKTNSQSTEWYLLKQDVVNPNAGKKIIQIGGYYISSDQMIQEVIKNFNAQNTEYRAEVLDYAFINEIKSKTDYEEMERAMNMMILSGEIPDILIGDSYNFNFPLYASKDLFMDLNTFIENDDSFHKEDYVDLVFDLPAIDDKLFYTFMSFSIEGIMTKKNTLEGGTGWTLDELESLIDASGKAENIFNEMSHSSLIYWFVSPSISNIVDMTSREADFDSEYFKKILNFCKKYGIPESSVDAKRLLMQASGEMEMWVDPREQMKSGEIPFNFDSCYSIEQWKTNWNMTGGDITLAGFPGENDNNLVCNPNTFVAIAKDRQNQDIAWELFKALFSLDAQEEVYSLPVLNEVFENQIADEQKPETDLYMALMEEYAPLSDDGAQALRDVLKKVKKMTVYNTQIIDIITEESAAFFANQKDIDATVRVIQQRITTYLNQL